MKRKREENRELLRLIVEWSKPMESCARMNELITNTNVIEACRQGSREAFRELYETYKDRVYSIALHTLNGDETAAEDAAQQVFLKLFTHIQQFRSDSSFTTWLYRLTVNVCIDEQRRRKRFAPLIEAAQTPSPEPSLPEREIEESVQTAIASLKPKFRMPILMKYFDDLSYEEMAAALGCSKGTIASRINRGHKQLAQKLAHLKSALFSGE